MRSLRRFTALAYLLAGAGTLMAQDTTSTLLGNITSMGTGKPVGGVQVIVKSAALLGERRTTTNPDGSYRIPLLPNGEYTVTAKKAGFTGGTVRLTIIAGRTIRQDIRIKSLEEAQGATVEVVSNLAPQVDKTETTTQTAIAQDTVNLLFSSGLSHAIDIAPGVSGSAGTPSIRGGNDHSVKFVVNGLSANEVGWGYSYTQRYVLEDMVESWNIIQSPLNARYGNTESGMISIVTKKGSNNFSGSLRVQYDRSNLYGSVDQSQPMRNGQGINYPQIGDDSPNRNYQATLSGPIIEDVLTFAWGGRFTPQTNSLGTMMFAGNDPAFITDVKSYKNTTGTLYTDPNTGVEFRKAYIGDHKVTFPQTSKHDFNQYALFWQVTADHSLEYNFTQSEDSNLYHYGNEVKLNGMDRNGARQWNIGYKGLVGKDGVLEARVGKQTAYWIHPTMPGNYPIDTFFYSTWQTAGSPNGKPWFSTPLASWDNQTNPSARFNGIDNDNGDSIFNESRFINYQKLVQWHGQHSIDVGYNFEKGSWDTQSGGAPMRAFVPGGMIAPDIQDNGMDVVRNGYTGAINMADYAGKYIMWPKNMLLSTLDPAYANYYPGVTIGDPNYWYADLVPTLTIREGAQRGLYSQTTESFYVNDQWTLNSYHSVMAGVRLDRFKLEDESGVKHRYSMYSPRFEYKWDLEGNQARVLSISFARFHNRQPIGLFQGFVQKRLGYVSTWRFDHGTTPQLFTKDQVFDPQYYNTLLSATFPGSAVLDPNWKADYSNELAFNFRRSYSNGGFWRASVISRRWHNAFRWLPMAPVYPSNPYNAKVSSTAPVLPSLLRNDEISTKHTYNSLELEWQAPLTKRLTFAGNYTFARNVQNTPGATRNPSSASAAYGTPGANWDAYLSRYVPMEVLKQAWSSQSDHVFKTWLTYDLTVGAYKSSVALLANYWSGDHDQRGMNWQLPSPPSDLIPGYTDKGYTAGIPNSVYIPVGARGTYIKSEWMDFGFKYNIEIPISGKLCWWSGIEIKQPFNHIWTTDADTGPVMNQDLIVGQNPATAMTSHGWRAEGNAVNKIKGRQGYRQLWVETGFRF